MPALIANSESDSESESDDDYDGIAGPSAPAPRAGAGHADMEAPTAVIMLDELSGTTWADMAASPAAARPLRTGSALTAGCGRSVPHRSVGLGRDAAAAAYSDTHRSEERRVSE